MEIQLEQFQEQCLSLIGNLDKLHDKVTIIQNGKPIAELLSLSPKTARKIFGALKGTVAIHGDLVLPTGESWNAEQ